MKTAKPTKSPRRITAGRIIISEHVRPTEEIEQRLTRVANLIRDLYREDLARERVSDAAAASSPAAASGDEE